MLKRALIAFFMLLAMDFGLAAQGACTVVSETCVDATPSKTFYGQTFALADVGGCWQWNKVYECVDTVGQDFCSEVAASSGCQQTSVACTDPSCTTYQDVYKCFDPLAQVRTEVTRLSDVLEVTADMLDDTQCQALKQDSSCQQTQDVCTEANSTKNIGGLNVSRECWTYDRTYACMQGVQDKCATKLAQGCQYSGPATCNPAGLPDAVCPMLTHSLLCPQAMPAVNAASGSCSSVTCVGLSCFPDDRTKDNDLSKVAAGMEILNQASLYYKDGLFFSGLYESCQSGGLWGLYKNCCSSTKGATSDAGTLLQNEMIIRGAGGALTYGFGNVSNATYSFLQGTSIAGQYMPTAVSAAYAERVASLPSNVSLSGSFGNMIPGLSIGGPASAAAGETAKWIGSNISSSLGAALNPVEITQLSEMVGTKVFFNPLTLYITAAMMVYAELQTCPPEDQMHSMKVGANLCKDIGEYCADWVTFLGKKIACRKTKIASCCYVSTLAKAINIASRNQFHGGFYGNPEDPSLCQGLTLDELQQLDWSKVDMTDFINEIMAGVHNVNAQDVQNAQTAVQQKLINKMQSK